jgi:hypothetical protein
VKPEESGFFFVIWIIGKDVIVTWIIVKELLLFGLLVKTLLPSF